jgi:acetyl esterase/lipase
MLTATRWLLAVISVVMAIGGLFTVFMAPSWMDWRLRLALAGMEGEYGYKFLILPIGLALTAWLLPNRQRLPNRIAIVASAVAFALMINPIFQAWNAGRTLQDKLGAAFGGVAPQVRPFSVAALYAKSPDSVPAEEMYIRDFLAIDFYRAIGRRPAPCVIFIHGLRLSSGGHHARRPFYDYLARNGYAVATPDFQGFIQAHWPAQRADIVDTINFLRAHAGPLGINPTRLVLMGGSAGGMLAEAVGYSAHDSGIRGIVSFAGPTDMRATWDEPSNDVLEGWTQRALAERFLGGTPATVPQAFDSVSAVALAGPTSPPTLLIHGRLDSTVPELQSERLGRKLAALGVPHAIVTLPCGTHGFDMGNFAGPSEQLINYSVAEFLATVTK